MRIDWDEEKNRRNLGKHGVSFERASLAFQDPLALNQPDPCEDEERWQTLGLVNGVVVLLVVHTLREEGEEEVVRMISARKATRVEREAYDQSH
jgi:uncharacterized DUF497 family protein